MGTKISKVSPWIEPCEVCGNHTSNRVKYRDGTEFKCRDCLRLIHEKCPLERVNDHLWIHPSYAPCVGLKSVIS